MLPCCHGVTLYAVTATDQFQHNILIPTTPRGRGSQIVDCLTLFCRSNFYFSSYIQSQAFNITIPSARFQRWLKEKILPADEMERLSSDQLISQSECDEISKNLEIDYDILMEMNPKLKRQKAEILNDAKYRIEATQKIREKLVLDNEDLAKELETQY